MVQFGVLTVPKVTLYGVRQRKGGQERNRRDAFAEECEFDRPPSPVLEGGYSVEDARTLGALTEDTSVHIGERGPTYAVEGESGSTYHS